MYMAGLEAEWMSFVQAVISGMIVCWGYFCIRKMRRIIPHNLLAVSIEDGLFWLAAAIYLFVQIYHTSSGSIRWYFVLGVVIGALFVGGIIRWIEKKYQKKQS